MSGRFKEELLSPQFKETEQDLSTQECRKFSSISAVEFNTPETKYRSTIGPNKTDISKEINSLHYRNKTAKFEDDYQKLYQQIKELYDKRQFDEPELVEPKVQFKTDGFPKRIIIKRQKKESQSLFNDQDLIDKMHQANQLSLQNLYSYQF